ncbi:MAPEG family protein [soil metagenome]
MDPQQIVVSTAGHAAALWTGLNLLLLLVLSLLVVRQRRAHKVMICDEGVPELVRASRAFGNAVEYVPVCLVGLAVLAAVGAPALLIHALGGALFIGRAAHAVGLSRSASTSPGRAIGTLFTWIVMLATGVLLVIFSAP